MSEGNNGVWGFEFEGVEAMSSGYPTIPEGNWVFRVIGNQSGVAKNGDNFVQVVLEVLEGDDPDWIGKQHRHYLSKAGNKLGFLVGFYTDIGAAHVLQPDAGPDDAIGTEFSVDLSHFNKVDEEGNKKTYVNMRNIISLNAAPGTEEEDQVEEEVEERPAPSKRTKREAPKREAAKRTAPKRKAPSRSR